MNSNVSAGISENPVKEGFLSLIQAIRNIEDFSGTFQDMPDELQQIVKSLQGQGVDLSGVSALQGGELLQQLEKFFRDNFHGAKDLLREVSSVFPDAIQSTLDLSPVAKVQRNFTRWLENNNDYATQHKIQENVKITNDGIELGGQVLRWSGHQFGGVNVQSDEDLEKQPYTIEQMGHMIQALGGNKLELKDEYRLGGKEISLFLSEVANIELGRFLWSSSRHEDSNYHAWGLFVGPNGVYVNCSRRGSEVSSLSS